MAIAAIAVTPVAAAQTTIAVDGGLDVGYSKTDTEGIRTIERVYTEARPGLTLQFGSPKLVWRAGYLFSGTLTLVGEEGWSYSNNLSLSLAAELDARTTMTGSASVSQGSTESRLTHRAPEAGVPALREAEIRDLLTATLSQGLTHAASPVFRLSQGLTASFTAPQDDPGRVNSEVSATFGADRLFPRDAIGGAYAARFASLRPLTRTGGTSADALTNSLQGSWNHDFDPTWNGQLTAGVEHVSKLGGDSDSAFHPVGSLTVRYFAGRLLGSLSLARRAEASLELGTLSLTDEVVARGVLNLDPVRPRNVSASVGFLRSRGSALEGVPSTTADAVHVDVGAIWEFTEMLLGTARYSLVNQIGDDEGGVARSRIHLAVVGLTIRWANVRHVPPPPSSGGRVDGSDAVGLPGDTRKRE